jgi:hypothetical protein
MKTFDCFISFKNTDAGGERTRDAQLARQIYEYLSGRGLRVFFSEVTLEHLGISDYKHTIDEALDGTDILIAVGTSTENLQSQWVRYELDSFTSDILSNRKPQGLIFSYVAGMRVEDLPRTLRTYQVVTHTEDSDTSLRKLHAYVYNGLPAERRRPEMIPPTPLPSSPAGVGSAAGAGMPGGGLPAPPVPKAASVPVPPVPGVSSMPVPPMSESTRVSAAPPVRARSRMPLVFGVVVLLLALAGGGYAFLGGGNARQDALTEESVRTFFDGWLAAWNAVDAGAYTSCYSTQFYGIKRQKNGKKLSFDFKAWIDDRLTTSRNAVDLRVEAADVVITIDDATHATVRFEQIYRSKKYSDKGPKVLKIRLENGVPLIVYEELEHSTAIDNLTLEDLGSYLPVYEEASLRSFSTDRWCA